MNRLAKTALSLSLLTIICLGGLVLATGQGSANAVLSDDGETDRVAGIERETDIPLPRNA